MNQDRSCPTCKRPLPQGALAGLCPACLLAQGAETKTTAGGHAPRFEPPPPEKVATLFPQLEILGLLGAGGMGAVYRARQPALDRFVALKILPAMDAGTANFEERFLQKNYLEGLDAGHGKFRAFLLASLKHFLANEWDKAGRQKRGGGAQHLSLDWQDADERFHIEPADHLSPDLAFDREWALALLERVITRLRDECVADGKAQLFEQAKGYLMVGEPAIPYAQAAQALGVDEGAVRVAVHRLRKRYRALLRDEIAQTLADLAQVAEELRSLQAVLAS